PNFRLYQSARFLTICAAEMTSVAVGWQIFDITRRPLDLGYAGLMQFLPGILLFLVAGQVADHFDRRKILLTCFAGFAVCGALLFWFSHIGMQSPRPIYLVLLLIGVVRAFNGPTGQAFLPLLVSEQHFPNAVAWSSSIFMTATIVGPTLGGIVYWLAGGPQAVYGSSIIAFLCAFSLVLIIRLQNVARPRRGVNLETVLAGFRFMGQNRIVLGAITLDMFAVLLGGAVALLPVYAREILMTGPKGLGLLRAAPGIGAAIMAIVIAHHPLKRRAGAVMLWCVAGFGVFTIIFGLSRNIVLSMTALLLVGATDMVSVIVRSTLIQLNTPDAMRGRVSAVNTLFIGTSNEFGQFESGITAQWFGTVPAVVLGGVGTILVVLLWAGMFPQLRRVNELAPQRTEIPEESNVTADPNE
ncbi:MAG TPA: MFS transporter, partial [Terriglobales bacterium]